MLVAIVVISVGLLGLAGLQASGMRVSQSSIYRSQAAQLAYDMADRVRANLAALEDYALPLEAEPPAGDSLPERDLRDWRRRLLALPGGTGAVVVGATDVTIVVQWDDTRGAGAMRGTASDDAARATLAASQFRLDVQLVN